MPGWRPLPRIAFAICIYPFQPSATADLPLEIGDELYIIEQGGRDDAWYRGYLVAPPSLLAGLTSVKGQTLEARVFSGIFPRACVDVREVLGERKGFSEQGGELDPRSLTQQVPAELATNGILTPTRSTGAISPANRGSSTHAGNGSKPDISSTLSKPTPRPLSRRRSAKRTGSWASQWTVRSDRAQHPVLPLSPISPGFRDPNAPRPPAPVPMLKIGDETPTSAQEPLVDEIASCLREWHATKLHELLLARKYASLDTMWTLVRRLDTARRQLLHMVLTAKELEGVREAAVWDLVAGNKMLSGDVIVRSPSLRGRILTVDDSVIEITKLQSMMSLLDSRPIPHVDDHTLHHLFVNLKQVHGDVAPGAAQITMHLTHKVPGLPPVPISEAYSFDLTTRNGAPVPLPCEKLRALFTNLSSTDIGEGAGSGSHLFLIVRLHTHESAQADETQDRLSPREGSTGTATGLRPSQMVGSMKGRRSVMFGSKRKDSTASTSSSGDGRPASASTYRSNSRDDGPESAITRQKSHSKPGKTLKRTVAVGVIRVNQIMKSGQEADYEVSLWSVPKDLDEVAEEDTGWDELLPEILPSGTGSYHRYTPIGRITIHVRSFADADPEALIEKTPTLLHNIRPTRKIGFSGAPTKPRSDIYLTLVEAFLPKNAFLAHPKTGTVPLATGSSLRNIQLTIEVRKASGERIEGCLFPSANSPGYTAWRTTAVERGEKWNFTVRLAIDPEDVPGSHIVMSIADAPGFPFALCWMPLWNKDAFARDGEKSLSLYRYDEYTSSMIAGKGAYLGLPWSTRKQDEQVLGPMASLHLRTYLCSTKYSQDPDLLGLLKWRDQPGGGLVKLLKRLSFVPEIEIVKLLNEVFGALFEILVEYAGSDEYEDLVFNALTVILGIVHDRRFNLGPLVDQYAETNFHYPFATACLLRSYNRLLNTPTDPESSRRLRATFKVGRHILKFIVNARQQQNEKEAGIGITGQQPNFTKDLQAVFRSLEALMNNPAPALIGTKTILVQNFHTWLPELATSMSAMEIFNVASKFIESCSSAQGKLILFKLLLISHISKLDLFKSPDLRRILLSNTVKWLAPHWGKTETVTEQWKDQVRLCCSVVASQIEELGQEACDYIPKLIASYRAIQTTVRPKKRTLSLLFPTSYPFLARPTVTEEDFDEALIEISAVLAAMSNLPTVIHLEGSKEDLAEFLFSMLLVYISILDCEAFPSSWLSVHVYHHKAAMRALEKLSGMLMDSFLPHPDDADHFNTNLWRAFFDALLKLVGSDALALETFPEQKRRAVWKIAGDVREMGADLLQRSWEAIGWETSMDDKMRYGLEKMGGFQVQYVPGLVEPVVELCLSVHEGLRSVAIEVLQTMIVSEWTLSEDLSLIQAEMIECLDHLFKTKKLTEVVLQKNFIQELFDLFEPISRNSEDSLYLAVKTLVTTIDELLDLLLAVHSPDAAEVFYIMDTLHLMEFLKDLQKEDIYIRYVHRLVKLQADAQNSTEAGLALRLHAELYDWDPTINLDPLLEPDFAAQTSFDRKEQLYFQMIEYYEYGHSWEQALSAYRELATQYEHNIFDFAKLARTQHAMAKIYANIAKGDLPHARYFRVVYRGLGFPVGLRDKHFIFEGLPSDRIHSFTDRLMQQHPSAIILLPGMEPDVEGQYLEVYPVSAQRDLSHPIYQRVKVAQTTREYFLLSRPSIFMTHSRRINSDAASKEVTVEKTLYTTAERFPTILRRSEIIGVGTVTLNSTQTAVERTTRKTGELAAFEKRIQDGEGDAVFSSLTDEISVAVDPGQETSIAIYHDLLPKRALGNEADEGIDDDDFEEEDLPVELSPMENALKVALMDYALVLRRCLALYTRPAQQATRVELTQKFELVFASELSSLAPAHLTQAPIRSPTGSWLGTNTRASSGGRVTSIAFNSFPLINGANNDNNSGSSYRANRRSTSRKRGSLGFFSKNATSASGAALAGGETSRPYNGSSTDQGVAVAIITPSSSPPPQVSTVGAASPQSSNNQYAHSLAQSLGQHTSGPITAATAASSTVAQSKDSSNGDVSDGNSNNDGNHGTLNGIPGIAKATSMKKRFSNLYYGKNKGSKGSGRGLKGETVVEE